MNNFAYNLTKLYISLGIGGRVRGIQKVKVPHYGETEVVVFSNRKAYQLGQATIWETIIIEESVLSGLAPDARDYLLLHEYLHCIQDGTPLLMPVILFALPLALFPLMSASLALQLFIDTGLTVHLNDAVTYLFVASLCVMASVFSSWWLEGEAEYDTIAILGKEKVFAALRKMREFYGKEPLWHRLVSAVTHPPLGTVVRLYDYCHRKAETRPAVKKAV